MGSIQTGRTPFTSPEQDLQAKLDAEILRSTKADENLKSKIDAEVYRATKVESDLQTQISTEVKRATDIEIDLKSKIDAEVDRATSTEQDLQTKIEEEITRASESEKFIHSKIESEIDRAKEVEEDLQSQIDEKFALYNESNKTIQSKIKSDVKHTVNIENELYEIKEDLQSQIDEELAFFNESKQVIESQIVDEADRAAIVEEGLDQRVTSLENRLSTLIESFYASQNVEQNDTSANDSRPKLNEKLLRSFKKIKNKMQLRKWAKKISTGLSDVIDTIKSSKLNIFATKQKTEEQPTPSQQIPKQEQEQPTPSQQIPRQEQEQPTPSQQIPRQEQEQPTPSQPVKKKITRKKKKTPWLKFWKTKKSKKKTGTAIRSRPARDGDSQKPRKVSSSKGRSKSGTENRLHIDALYTKIPTGPILPLKLGDSLADILSKIYNLIYYNYKQSIKQSELWHNFEQEQKDEELREHEKQIKKSSIWGDKKEKSLQQEDQQKEKGGFLKSIAGGLGTILGVLGTIGKTVGSIIGGVVSTVSKFLLGASISLVTLVAKKSLGLVSDVFGWVVKKLWTTLLEPVFKLIGSAIGKMLPGAAAVAKRLIVPLGGATIAAEAIKYTADTMVETHGGVEGQKLIRDLGNRGIVERNPLGFIPSVSGYEGHKSKIKDWGAITPEIAKKLIKTDEFGKSDTERLEAISLGITPKTVKDTNGENKLILARKSTSGDTWGYDMPGKGFVPAASDDTRTGPQGQPASIDVTTGKHGYIQKSGKEDIPDMFTEFKGNIPTPTSKTEDIQPLPKGNIPTPLELSIPSTSILNDRIEENLNLNLDTPFSTKSEPIVINNSDSKVLNTGSSGVKPWNYNTRPNESSLNRSLNNSFSRSPH